MDYGCNSSGAPTSDMVWAYEYKFRYHDFCSTASRDDYSATSWFELIKGQINQNRPIQYRIPNHSIVCDGWQVVGSDKQYHMNYGWDDSATTWYTLDELFGGNLNDEYLILNIFPITSLGADLLGYYSPQTFPYRYFDQDASGVLATFYWGQWLQTLPGIKTTGTSSSTYVEFLGLTNSSIHIFTGGNSAEGIVINNATVRLKNNGSIKLSEP
jgi:hypothetical protein